MDEVVVKSNDDGHTGGNLSDIYQFALPSIPKGSGFPCAQILRKYTKLPFVPKVPSIPKPEPEQPDAIFFKNMDWEKGKICTIFVRHYLIVFKVARL